MTQTGSDFSPFGKLLNTFRKRAHLTQHYLSEALGVHRSTLVRWEQGTAMHPEGFRQPLLGEVLAAAYRLEQCSKGELVTGHSHAWGFFL